MTLPKHTGVAWYPSKIGGSASYFVRHQYTGSFFATDDAWASVGVEGH
jgi:hypothetical protein